MQFILVHKKENTEIIREREHGVPRRTYICFGYVELGICESMSE